MKDNRATTFAASLAVFIVIGRMFFDPSGFMRIVYYVALGIAAGIVTYLIESMLNKNTPG